ncbi:FAD binding domain-containing protein [Solidesulfovibrio sp.]|uniref:FAD binding domain-containing protein n=1 Tax=Solidesulfovibrio sp. TaxID=2910990 RepID=UPI002B1F97B9|nr:FAD binding domain-containing protein [Solidesulfovibrio sp.]MEA5087944.1 FAD binding domain-containing protein [Solidesulfovibrio sp.]
MNGRVFRPDRPEALWPLLEGGARPMAGGTDLLVRLRRQPPCDVALLEGLPGLDAVSLTDGQIRLGATVTHARLLAHPLVRERLPALARALADLVLGPGRTALARGEIVAAVLVSPPPPEALQHFEKVGRRDALAIAVASLAAVIVRDDAGRVTEARLAVGSLGPTVTRCLRAEAFLRGRGLDRETLAAVGRRIREAVSPIDDIRATAAYRLRLAGNLPLRLLRP